MRRSTLNDTGRGPAVSFWARAVSFRGWNRGLPDRQLIPNDTARYHPTVGTECPSVAEKADWALGVRDSAETGSGPVSFSPNSGAPRGVRGIKLPLWRSHSIMQCFGRAHDQTGLHPAQNANDKHSFSVPENEHGRKHMLEDGAALRPYAHYGELSRWTMPKRRISVEYAGIQPSMAASKRGFVQPRHQSNPR